MALLAEGGELADPPRCTPARRPTGPLALDKILDSSCRDARCAADVAVADICQGLRARVA
jgi:hypothetical protein